MKFDPKIIDVTKIFSNVYDSTSRAVKFTDSTYTHRFAELLKKKMIENYDSILSSIQKYKNSKDYCETEKDNLSIMETIVSMYKKQLTDGIIPDDEVEIFCKDIMCEDYNRLKTEVENELKISKASSENVSHEASEASQKVSNAENEDLKDILNTIKNNNRRRIDKVESKNISLKEYMKTLKDFYGELTIHTLRDNYEDSFMIQFFTDKISDDIINKLENYKDYEVFDVRDSQYCSNPPINCKCIILDNRKDRSFW